MRRWFVSLLTLSLLLAGAAGDEPPGKPPEGFKPLFNSKDLDGWKVYGGNTASWGVEKGVLFVKGGGGGWLMTEKEYGDFELRLDFKVPAGGNSGVALRSPRKGNPAFAGMEIQILDEDHPSHKGIKDWQRTGSIYAVAPPKKLATKPVGQWNRFRIVCKGRQVTVELNGEKIVDANLDDHKAKAKDNPGILRDKGHIGLQEHGGRVEFRNLYIKEL